MGGKIDKQVIHLLLRARQLWDESLVGALMSKQTVSRSYLLEPHINQEHNTILYCPVVYIAGHFN